VFGAQDVAALCARNTFSADIVVWRRTRKRVALKPDGARIADFIGELNPT